MCGHGMGDYPPGTTGKDIDRLEMPFGDPPECCGTCNNYNGTFCTKYWNNLDECYKVTWRDSKDPEDWCEDYELSPYPDDYDLEDIDIEEIKKRKEQAEYCEKNKESLKEHLEKFGRKEK